MVRNGSNKFMTPQVDPSHYVSGYDGKGRFMSYWHQIDEVLKLKPERILEIGIGTSMVWDYLKRRKLTIVTIDIDPALKPDCIASVLSLPFRDGSFDAVVCFQVLEHIPFDSFLTAVTELGRVCRRHVLISLPDRTRHLHISVKLYPFIQKSISITVPQLFFPAHQFDDEHYWEIGKKGFTLRKIKAAFETNSLALTREFRVPEKPLHHFFLLRKSKESITGRK